MPPGFGADNAVSRRSQNKSLKEAIQDLQPHIKESTESVIEARLAFDEADRSQSLAIEDAREVNGDPEYDPATRQWTIVMARVTSRKGDLVDDMSAVTELSVAENSRPSADAGSAYDGILDFDPQTA